MKLKTRQHLMMALNEGEITLRDGKVKAYPVKAGALCTLSKIGDMVIFSNGQTTFTNDSLGLYLYPILGDGCFIVQHTTMTIGVSKWLTYSQYNTPFEEWSKDIIIHTFEGPERTGDICIRTTEPIWLYPDGIRKVNEEYSISKDYDGLYVTEADPEKPLCFYHLFPSRFCLGKVISHRMVEGKEDFVVVEIEQDGITYYSKVTKFTKTMTNDLINYETQLTGRILKLQYSTFFPGERMENFSSLSALFLINRP